MKKAHDTWNTWQLKIALTTFFAKPLDSKLLIEWERRMGQIKC